MAAPTDTLCMAAADCTCNFAPLRLKRRAMNPNDVVIDMRWCGVCHSDVHIAQGMVSVVAKVAYPIVPGHELAGVISAVGSQVTKFKVGDHVGVGCMVDSCLNCAACQRGEEQKCSQQVGTYNGRDNGSGRAASHPPGSQTLGGYTTTMVVHEHFAIKIPESYPLEFAGPVMCAGITMYDPLVRYGASKGTKLGVVGLGGLGQMGVRLGKALGCEVTAISRGEGKRALATECGADHYLVSSDAKAMEAAHGTLDLILNTISTDHDYHAYTKLTTHTGGKHIVLGLNSALGAALLVDTVVCGASRVKFSGIGGIKNTQAVIDLCAEHNIRPEIKIIGVHELNSAYEALEKGNDAGVRYVLDIAGTLNEDAFAKCTAPPPDLSTGGTGMTTWGMLSTAAGMLFTGKWI